MTKTINLVFKAALIICCYMNYKDAKPYSSFSKIFSQQREPVEKEAVKKNHRSVKLIDIVTVILWFPPHTSSQYSAGKSSNVILYYTSLGCFNEGRFLVICLSVLKIVVRQSEFKAENMNSWIKHLNHWYWIDEGDFASQRTFTFLMLLFWWWKVRIQRGRPGEIRLVHLGWVDAWPCPRCPSRYLDVAAITGNYQTCWGSDCA